MNRQNEFFRLETSLKYKGLLDFYDSNNGEQDKLTQCGKIACETQG